MKILIFGYYGFDNLGDEAILKVLAANLPRQLPFADITVVSHNPVQTSSALGVKAVSRSWPILRSAILACDVFMFGGGGLLQDATSLKSLLFHLFLLHYAKKHGKKVVLLAQGIGPIKSRIGRRWMIRVLTRVDLITVRDAAAYTELVNLKINPDKIFLTGDLVPLLDDFSASSQIEMDSLQRETNRGREGTLPAYLQIGVAPRSLLSGQQNLINCLAETCDRLIESLGAQITFLAMQPQDVQTINKIKAKMKHPSRVVFGNLTEVLAKIGQLNLMVGVRLHALIFAAMLKVPGLALAYDPKVSAFADLMEMPKFAPAEVSPDLLFEKICREIKQSAATWQKRAQQIDVLRANTWLNFSLLKSFLRAYPTVSVLGVKLHNLLLFEAVDFCRHCIEEKIPRQIITVNPELVYLAAHDEKIKNLVNAVDLATVDGAGLLWAAKYLGRPVHERITGIDLMEQLFPLADRHHYKIFLLGGRPEIIEKARAVISQKYPGIKIVGAQSGYFTDDFMIKEKIKAAQPDILFVGLGAPIQDFWIAKNKAELGVPLSIGVGGSFDVISGFKKRAPRWVQKIRAEWVYRLLKEPRARFNRQLNLFRFMWLVRKEKGVISSGSTL